MDTDAKGGFSPNQEKNRTISTLSGLGTKIADFVSRPIAREFVKGAYNAFVTTVPEGIKASTELAAPIIPDAIERPIINTMDSATKKFTIDATQDEQSGYPYQIGAGLGNIGAMLIPSTIIGKAKYASDALKVEKAIVKANLIGKQITSASLNRLSLALKEVGFGKKSIEEASKIASISNKFTVPTVKNIASAAGAVGAQRAAIGTSSILGASLESGEAGNRAKEAKADSETQYKARLLGVPIGIIENISQSRLLRRLGAPFMMKMGDQVSSKVSKGVLTPLIAEGVEVLKSGGVEGLEEWVQNAAQNLVAQNLYNPDQDIMEGNNKAFIIGAVSGGLFDIIGRSITKSTTPNKPIDQIVQEFSTQLDKDLGTEEGQLRLNAGIPFTTKSLMLLAKEAGAKTVAEIREYLKQNRRSILESPDFKQTDLDKADANLSVMGKKALRNILTKSAEEQGAREPSEVLRTTRVTTEPSAQQILQLNQAVPYGSLKGNIAKENKKGLIYFLDPTKWFNENKDDIVSAVGSIVEASKTPKTTDEQMKAISRGLILKLYNRDLSEWSVEQAKIESKKIGEIVTPEEVLELYKEQIDKAKEEPLTGAALKAAEVRAYTTAMANRKKQIDEDRQKIEDAKAVDQTQYTQEEIDSANMIAQLAQGQNKPPVQDIQLRTDRAARLLAQKISEDTGTKGKKLAAGLIASSDSREGAIDLLYSQYKEQADQYYQTSIDSLTKDLGDKKQRVLSKKEISLGGRFIVERAFKKLTFGINVEKKIEINNEETNKISDSIAATISGLIYDPEFQAGAEEREKKNSAKKFKISEEQFLEAVVELAVDKNGNPLIQQEKIAIAKQAASKLKQQNISITKGEESESLRKLSQEIYGQEIVESEAYKTFRMERGSEEPLENRGLLNEPNLANTRQEILRLKSLRERYKDPEQFGKLFNPKYSYGGLKTSKEIVQLIDSQIKELENKKFDSDVRSSAFQPTERNIFTPSVQPGSEKVESIIVPEKPPKRSIKIGPLEKKESERLKQEGSDFTKRLTDSLNRRKSLLGEQGTISRTPSEQVKPEPGDRRDAVKTAVQEWKDQRARVKERQQLVDEKTKSLEPVKLRSGQIVGRILPKATVNNAVIDRLNEERKLEARRREDKIRRDEKNRKKETQAQEPTTAPPPNPTIVTPIKKEEIQPPTPTQVSNTQKVNKKINQIKPQNNEIVKTISEVKKIRKEKAKKKQVKKGSEEGRVKDQKSIDKIDEEVIRILNEIAVALEKEQEETYTDDEINSANEIAEAFRKARDRKKAIQDAGRTPKGKPKQSKAQEEQKPKKITVKDRTQFETRPVSEEDVQRRASRRRRRFSTQQELEESDSSAQSRAEVIKEYGFVMRYFNNVINFFTDAYNYIETNYNFAAPVIALYRTSVNKGETFISKTRDTFYIFNPTSRQMEYDPDQQRTTFMEEINDQVKDVQDLELKSKWQNAFGEWFQIKVEQQSINEINEENKIIEQEASQLKGNDKQRKLNERKVIFYPLDGKTQSYEANNEKHFMVHWSEAELKNVDKDAVSVASEITGKTKSQTLEGFNKVLDAFSAQNQEILSYAFGNGLIDEEFYNRAASREYYIPLRILRENPKLTTISKLISDYIVTTRKSDIEAMPDIWAKREGGTGTVENGLDALSSMMVNWSSVIQSGAVNTAHQHFIFRFQNQLLSPMAKKDYEKASTASTRNLLDEVYVPDYVVRELGETEEGRRVITVKYRGEARRFQINDAQLFESINRKELYPDFDIHIFSKSRRAFTFLITTRPIFRFVNALQGFLSAPGVNGMDIQNWLEYASTVYSVLKLGWTTTGNKEIDIAKFREKGDKKSEELYTYIENLNIAGGLYMDFSKVITEQSAEKIFDDRNEKFLEMRQLSLNEQVLSLPFSLENAFAQPLTTAGSSLKRGFKRFVRGTSFLEHGARTANAKVTERNSDFMMLKQEFYYEDEKLIIKIEKQMKKIQSLSPIADKEALKEAKQKLVELMNERDAVGLEAAGFLARPVADARVADIDFTQLTSGKIINTANQFIAFAKSTAISAGKFYKAGSKMVTPLSVLEKRDAIRKKRYTDFEASLSFKVKELGQAAEFALNNYGEEDTRTKEAQQEYEKKKQELDSFKNTSEEVQMDTDEARARNVSIGKAFRDVYIGHLIVYALQDAALRAAGNDDDENAPTYQRNSFFRIPLPGGNSILVPSGFAFGPLARNTLDAFYIAVDPLWRKIDPESRIDPSQKGKVIINLLRSVFYMQEGRGGVLPITGYYLIRNLFPGAVSPSTGLPYIPASKEGVAQYYTNENAGVVFGLVADIFNTIGIEKSPIEIAKWSRDFLGLASNVLIVPINRFLSPEMPDYEKAIGSSNTVQIIKESFDNLFVGSIVQNGLLNDAKYYGRVVDTVAEDEQFVNTFISGKVMQLENSLKAGREGIDGVAQADITNKLINELAESDDLIRFWAIYGHLEEFRSTIALEEMAKEANILNAQEDPLKTQKERTRALTVARLNGDYHRLETAKAYYNARTRALRSTLTLDDEPLEMGTIADRKALATHIIENIIMEEWAKKEMRKPR